jgi:hypothetical protein
MNYTDKELNLKDLVLDFTVDGKDVGTIVTKKDIVIAPKQNFLFQLNILTKHLLLKLKAMNHQQPIVYNYQVI